jgi:hypothetical protein
VGRPGAETVEAGLLTAGNFHQLRPASSAGNQGNVAAPDPESRGQRGQGRLRGLAVNRPGGHPYDQRAVAFPAYERAGCPRPHPDRDSHPLQCPSSDTTPAIMTGCAANLTPAGGGGRYGRA